MPSACDLGGNTGSGGGGATSAGGVAASTVNGGGGGGGGGDDEAGDGNGNNEGGALAGGGGVGSAGGDGGGGVGGSGGTGTGGDGTGAEKAPYKAGFLDDPALKVGRHRHMTRGDQHTGPVVSCIGLSERSVGLSVAGGNIAGWRNRVVVLGVDILVWKSSDILRCFFCG